VRFLDRAGNSQPTPFSLMLVALGIDAGMKTAWSNFENGFWLARTGG